MDEEIKQVSESAQYVTQFLIDNGAKIFSAIFVLALGYWLSGWLRNLLLRMMEKKGMDITLAKFVSGCVRLIILMMAVLFAIAKFYSISPLVALLGASAFGLTLAIQGPISNYGAGLMIIITRPFVVGNTLTVQGQYGQVKEITLAYTQMENEDGEVITIPNKHIMGEIFINSHECRIVEGVIGISYASDADTSIEAVLKACQGIEDVTQDPPPQVGIDAFADSSVNIGYRCWVPTKTFHATRFKINRAVYQAVQDCGADIPFPQLDVTVKK
ncbi:mechanosensitive ion channel family protein [Cerasicoccus arenae]|uniref:Mechanosensitive ion channel protein n=1 Tax=Cerasicoccus arenae TaxID=424488 RepID=A0A8J3DF20_9BACT|nr:mechanosensitive ion channel family protein [Cerasicoccus arenae]MBK1856649.1 mechanosensitive ion channel family protein [Cerasicoccus arenae]GHC12234.1 mechanosensitive ion channel protein [Cerasicoccus arenae]